MAESGHPTSPPVFSFGAESGVESGHPLPTWPNRDGRIGTPNFSSHLLLRGRIGCRIGTPMVESGHPWSNRDTHWSNRDTHRFLQDTVGSGHPRSGCRVRSGHPRSGCRVGSGHPRSGCRGCRIGMSDRDTHHLPGLTRDAHHRARRARREPGHPPSGAAHAGRRIVRTGMRTGTPTLWVRVESPGRTGRQPSPGVPPWTPAMPATRAVAAVPVPVGEASWHATVRLPFAA
jgi:hypothetical protein